MKDMSFDSFGRITFEDLRLQRRKLVTCDPLDDFAEAVRAEVDRMISETWVSLNMDLYHERSGIQARCELESMRWLEENQI